MREIRACLVCGSGSSRVLYEATFDGDWEDSIALFLTNREVVAHGTIRRCSECGFAFTSPQFFPEEYARIYGAISSDDPRAKHERGHKSRADKLRRCVEQYVSGGKFLDLGSGAGHFQHAMDGYDGYGFEVRPGGGFDYQEKDKCYVGNFIDFGADPDIAGSFDFITAWDVLEHLSELDGYMEALFRILAPGGFLFCSVPNVSSLVARVFGRRWNCLLLEHLWYFSPRTLTRYLERFGFQVVEIGPLGYRVDLQTVARRFAQTYGGPSLRLPKFAAERVIDMPIGLMYSVAQTPRNVET